MTPRVTGWLLVAVLTAGCAVPADEPVAEPTASPAAEPTAVPEPPIETEIVEPGEPPLPPEPEPLEDELAQEPAGLAEQLTLAHRTIRSDVPAERIALAGRLQQAATLELVKRPEWHDEVLAGLPDDVRGVVESDLEAGSALRSMVTPREELPAWRIVEPAPAEVLLDHYRAAEAEFGVPWAYLAAIHLVETRMGRIRGTSVAGAQGPMQFMPATWDAYGEGDVNDNRDAIMAAGRYLRASGAPADMPRALFAYNRSDRYVRAVDLYAQRMLEDPRAYGGYYHWQVYYLTVDGDVLLEVGYDA